MKLCYVDESGNDAQDPCLVMVGIVVDAQRLFRTQEEFGEIFATVQKLFDENLKELKGAKIIFGRDRWRNVDPATRKRIVEFFCNWLAERKHHIALAAIDRSKFKTHDGKDFKPVDRDPWLTASLHIALQLQKHHQGKKKNKGKTMLIFDENKQKADELTEILFEPPEWTDSFYQRDKKKAPLDQIIDTAFSVKSHHAGLVQVADIFALILRRYAELVDHSLNEVWEGEKDLIRQYTEMLACRLLPRSTRWPEKTTVKCCRWYNDIAPPSLLKLGSR